MTKTKASKTTTLKEVPHIKNDFQKYFAEFIGATILTFAVTLSAGYQDTVIATPLLAGLTLMILVYAFGSVSGAHFNPAVTLSIFLTRGLHYKSAVFYILAQVTGAMFAVAAIASMGLPLPEVTVYDGDLYFALEAIGTFLLAFGVASVVAGRTQQESSGLVIGGSLLAGATLASTVSLGILNPAIAISWGIVNLTYILGPIVGAFIAAIIYKLVITKK